MRSSDPHGDDGIAGGASTPTAVPADGSSYWAFYDEVASRQVLAWAPTSPSRVLDLSGPSTGFADRLAADGHDVLHACSRPLPMTTAGVHPVLADAQSLDRLADGSVDAVLAESRALSRCLATEVTVADLRRVLRPGGTMLLVVDSLGLGLARLAEQGRWAELADVPNADVVLVPEAGGSITRCFWPEELVELVTSAGLEVDWVRPRTVMTPAHVERALAAGTRATLGQLAASELELAASRTGQSPGLHLVVSARRPA